jgi:hypothetical protein
MLEGRRGRRSPLLISNVAQVIHVQNTEGASSTVSDVEQVALAHVDWGQPKSSGKGDVDLF